jgi:hypothetical protein
VLSAAFLLAVGATHILFFKLMLSSDATVCTAVGVNKSRLIFIENTNSSIFVSNIHPSSYYMLDIHCGENSRIFPDATDQTLPATEFSDICN